MISLNELLNFRNQHVIDRYKKEYSTSKLEADLAFQQVLKYLWLSEQHRRDLKNDPSNEALQFDCAMHHEMKEIDDMWHTFILFTREYMEFGEHYFGHYLHHAPNVDKTQLDKAKFKADFERFLNYTYDHLGEETVRLWFANLLEEETSN